MSLSDVIKSIAEKIEKVYLSGVDNGIKSVPVDQEYISDSKNAQSGIAVAEAIAENEGRFANIKTGEMLYLEDSSDSALKNLKLFGKTTQEGTPTFDTPVPFVNIGDSGSITICVKNDSEEQTLSVSTEIPLYGVPVKNNGNYTDSNGQQWICNEIDLQRGIYTKRINCESVTLTQFANFDNGNIYGVMTLAMKKREVTGAVLCENAEYKTGTSTPNTFYENTSNLVFKGDADDTKETLKEKFDGSKILYILADAEEIALTTEEVEAFKELHTYTGKTSISNSDSANMQVEYTGDIASYVKSETKNTTGIVSVASNATVFISNNGRLYIERNGDNIFVKPGGGICIYSSATGLTSYSWDDICDGLSKEGSTYIATSDMSVEKCLSLLYYRAFVYDVVYKKFKVLGHISESDSSTEIPLVFSNYGTIGGRLIESNNQDAFERLNEIDTKLNSIPTNEFSSANVAKIKEFSSLFNNTNNIESFIFFTDPHLTEGNGDWETEFKTYLNTLKEVEKRAPSSFIVCGGDWLGNSDLQTEACYKLGYVDSYMKSNFDDYHLVVGNHDTNYQGKLNSDSENWTGTITNNTIKNLWYRKEQKSYYRFEGQHTDYYVLDTQIESTIGTSEYSIEQLDWFASELIKNKSTHTAIFMHMYINQNDAGDGNPGYSDFSMAVGNIIQAYNSHASISISGINYDFSNCDGHIDYVMCGHTHIDYIETIGGVPCIITANMKNGNVPTFDLCLTDYDNNELCLVRIGTGENRTIKI